MLYALKTPASQPHAHSSVYWDLAALNGSVCWGWTGASRVALSYSVGRRRTAAGLASCLWEEDTSALAFCRWSWQCPTGSGLTMWGQG